jgi:uracil-DNA glycosylase family 4
MFPLTAASYEQLWHCGPFSIPGYPFYEPLSAGAPMVGPSFVAHARMLGDDYAEKVKRGGSPVVQVGPRLAQLYFQGLYDSEFMLPIITGARAIPAVFLPGRLHGADRAGPCRAPVMVIGKMPSRDEVAVGKNFDDPKNEHFWRACDDIGIPCEYTESWYLTNVIKFAPPDPNLAKAPAAWFADCMPILWQELQLVQPRYILCLGSDASKVITKMCPGAFGGREGLGIEAMRSRVEQLVIPKAGCPGEFITSQVMAVTSPVNVHRTPELMDTLRDGLRDFWSLTCGQHIGGIELDIDHRVIRDVGTLRILVDEILASDNPADSILAIDAEWNGQKPWDPGAYLRTVQFSHKAKFAACVELRGPGGHEVFQPSITAAAAELGRLFLHPKMRIGGHFLRADIPQIHAHLGIDLREKYAPAASADLVCTEGGWETSLMESAVNETGMMGLASLRAKYTRAPAYEKLLNKWLSTYCKSRGIEKKDIEGFGDWGGEDFYRYACLQNGSLVQLGDGSWVAIEKLVSTQYSGAVKAFKDGRVIDATVTGWHRQVVNQTEWRKLRTATTAAGKHGLLGPVFTPDHEIVTQRGKVRIEDLQLGRDCILTDESEFSAAQLSVFLGCMLGDGRLQRKNGKLVGFRFGQRDAKATYVDWKAAVFSTHGPKLRARTTTDQCRRYETPFSRYFSHLAARFPTKTVAEHGHCKVKITADVLNNLGDLGLVVWYQDVGVYISARHKRRNAVARIVCIGLDAVEECLALAWLSSRLGLGVTYNRRGCFFQITGGACVSLQRLVLQFGHPAMSYKCGYKIEQPVVVDQTTRPYYEPVLEIIRVPRECALRRGRGVRYCLTVPAAGNFLTKVGFVSNCYDADVTRRIAGRLFDAVKHDRFGHDCRQSYWLTHRASLAVLEMEQFGIHADPERAELLATIFSDARGVLVARMREIINWPEFNPNSDQQCRAVLFGEEYARKPAPAGCPTVRVMRGPEGGSAETAADAVKRAMRAVAAGTAAPPMAGAPCWVVFVPQGVRLEQMPPIISTGKRGIAWEKLLARGETENHRPATSRETLGILSYANPVAAILRDIRFLTKALQTVLRRPEIDPDTGDYMKDDEGDFVYEKGLLSHISSDGKVHTRISMDKETGRSASRDPALQNISKQREDDFQRILGWVHPKRGNQGDYTELLGTPKYNYVQRSIFKAPPGCVLMESDYAGAELAALMWMAQDIQGTEDVRRNMLPPNHPDYLDIHSNMAVMAFKLACEPSKKGLEDIQRLGYRIAAKNVMFGIPYGRMAEAIARQCREKGFDASIADAQMLIDYYFSRYAQVEIYLGACRDRTRNPLWIRGAFGRHRRFNWTEDRSVAGEQERKACNYSIQNLVADAVWTALYNMWEFRKRYPEVSFKFLLQIHDAILLAVPFASVPRVFREVFPVCMTDQVHVRPCNLDGILHPNAPVYHMGGDREIMFRWGEKVDKLIKQFVIQDPDFPGITELLEDPANDREVVRLLTAAERFN